MPGGFGQAGMLKQLQTLQEDMLKAQEKVAASSVTASAGGGAVTAVISGERRVESLSIDPDVVDPEDIDMLQDLIVAAINSGLEQIERETAERMSELTQGLGLPPGLL
jgi:DNA-binding YbaB/EbfC family protein